MQPIKQYKYLTFLTMLYITVKLITVILIYKIIYLKNYLASASTLIMPLWFILGDIITEVYGYERARHIIWMAVICQFIFALTCTTFSSMQSPPGWTHQDAYDQVLGHLPRVAVASFLAIMSGAFINSYAISKWKILMNGKHFWLRSLGASAVGELVFTLIAYLTEFLGVTSFSKLFGLMTISYVIKLLLNPVLVIPSIFITRALKKLEGVDVYDNHVNFNPFKLSLNETEKFIKPKTKLQNAVRF